MRSVGCTVQRTKLKTNIFKRSWALGASVLLHVLVLLGPGIGMWHGPVPEHSVMAVYLAMPAAPERAFEPRSDPGKKTVAEPAQPPSEPLALPELPRSEVQPSTAGMTPDKELQPDSVALQETKAAKQPETITEEVETAFLDETVESVTGTQPEMKNRDVEFASDNSKPFNATQGRHQAQNPASPMLAFAGDPVSLGVFGMDTPGPDLVKASILSLPEPLYPVLSRKRGEEGRVILEITISAQGAVRSAQVNRSSSYKRLDRAALAAIKKATFAPAIEYGTPVESTMKVAYRFELKGQ